MSIPLYLVTVSLIVTLVRTQDNLDVRLFCKDLPEEQVTCGEELEQRFNKATEVRFFISLYIGRLLKHDQLYLHIGHIGYFPFLLENHCYVP